MKGILFRGRRVDNGELVEGNLFISDTDGRCYILVGSRQVTIEYEVKPSTVGQYIGVKDKKKHKIFEGDIIHEIDVGCEAYGYTEFKIEKWSIVKEASFRDGIKLEKIKERRGEYAWGWNKCHEENYLDFYDVYGDIYVIGNIYDDPEIIKDAKKLEWTDKYKE